MPGQEISVDVLVVGGGLQGLLVLERLAAARLSCVLVTPGPLGSGQTLRSHGVLNTGFGMAGPEPVRILREIVLPDLARRGVETYGEWRSPAGSLPQVNVRVDRLLSAVSRGLEQRILPGTVAEVHSSPGIGVDAVTIQPSGIVVAPSAVVVAAGTGSKRLLRAFGAGEPQLAEIKHRKVHVLCVRGSSEVLPALDVVSYDDLMFVASHEQDGTRTYLATPMNFGGPHVDDVPDDASAEVDEELVAQGWETLSRVAPSLRSAPGLQFGAYAGYRQDIGDQPGSHMCERIEAVPNVVAALPSGLVAAWPVSMAAVELAAGMCGARKPQPRLDDAAHFVHVGRRYEEASLTWATGMPALHSV